MAASSSDASQPGMTTHRIEALADGIFAIAMTLLVLNLALPEAGKGLTGLHSLLFGQLDNLFCYALSFVLLAIFWIRHHQQFHFIKRTDGKHLWINIFFLMFVALMPFSTSLVGDYSNEPLAEVFFGSNIFMLSMLLLCSWTYATNHHRLVDPSLDAPRIALAKKRGTVTMLVAVLAMGLSFVNPQISSLAYLLIPVFLGVLEHQHRKATRGTV
jgi:uncharacterized membrane protein